MPLLPLVHADVNAEASRGLRHVLALALLRLLASPLIRTPPSTMISPAGIDSNAL